MFGCAQKDTTCNVDDTVKVSLVVLPVKGTIIKVNEPNDSLYTVAAVNAAIFNPFLNYVIEVNCN